MLWCRSRNPRFIQRSRRRSRNYAVDEFDWFPTPTASIESDREEDPSCYDTGEPTPQE